VKILVCFSFAVVCGRWCFLRAKSDIRRQRELNHTFAEAHITDSSVMRSVVPLLCGGIVSAYALRETSTLLMVTCTACVVTGIRASLVDIDTHTIPRKMMLSAIAFMLALLGLASFLVEGVSLVNVLLGGTSSWLLMRLLELVSRGDIGHADVVLSGYFGLFLGSVDLAAIPIALFAGFVVAGVVALVMIATKQMTRHSHLPFGPFLFVGMVVAVLR